MEKSTEEQIFSKDKATLSLMALNVILSVATVLTTLIGLRSHDFKIPVQYIVNDGSVLQTSNWYSLYSLALFSIVGTGVIIYLAQKLYRSNRVYSIGVLAAYSLVSVVGLSVTLALLNLVSKV